MYHFIAPLIFLLIIFYITQVVIWLANLHDSTYASKSEAIYKLIPFIYPLVLFIKFIKECIIDFYNL